MSNNDKFIRDTEFGKLMESMKDGFCSKCKYSNHENCAVITNEICFEEYNYYFAKDEIDENKNLQDLQK